MGRVILDAATRDKLDGVSRLLELYDEDGRLLGYCVPPGLVEAMRAAPAAYGPFTDAELTAAFAQTDPGRPLADILADLRRS